MTAKQHARKTSMEYPPPPPDDDDNAPPLDDDDDIPPAPQTVDDPFNIGKAFSKMEADILLLGLDGAGKTTMLQKLRLGEIVSTTPVEGFNIKTVKYMNMNITAWDVGGGGQGKIRQLWRILRYYKNIKGIIFMVDSTDMDRIDIAKYELQRLLAEEDDLREAVVLVYANKQDLPNAMQVKEVTNSLGLAQLDRHWHIQGSSAMLGDGLREGLDRFASIIDRGTKRSEGSSTQGTGCALS